MYTLTLFFIVKKYIILVHARFYISAFFYKLKHIFILSKQCKKEMIKFKIQVFFISIFKKGKENIYFTDTKLNNKKLRYNLLLQE